MRPQTARLLIYFLIFCSETFERAGSVWEEVTAFVCHSLICIFIHYPSWHSVCVWVKRIHVLSVLSPRLNSTVHCPWCWMEQWIALNSCSYWKRYFIKIPIMTFIRDARFANKASDHQVPSDVFFQCFITLHICTTSVFTIYKACCCVNTHYSENVLCTCK